MSVQSQQSATKGCAAMNTALKLAICFAVFASGSRATPASSAEPDEIGGRYERAVMIRNLEDGTDTEAVDFLEIQAKDMSSIFFVYESLHTNGHACRLYGTAHKTAAGQYEYVDSSGAEGACKARIYKINESIVLEDVDGGCQPHHCGARGQIGKSTFDLKSRAQLDRPVVVPW